MKSLLVTGNCPYNYYQERSLQEAGVNAHIFGEWGMHLPEHVDAILAEDPDIIHLQWPESLTQHKDRDPQDVVAEVKTALQRLHDSRARIFWVMHNLLPHNREKTQMWQEIWQLYASHCDVACHHSRCGRALATSTYDYGDARHEVLYHGYFDQFDACQLDEQAARQELGLPQQANIYLAVGALRPDKHIRELIECFSQRNPEKDILVLAGNASWTDYGKDMVALGKQHANVFIEEGFIEDDRVSLYASACASFLYMYGENHLTSGSPHMSQAFLLPQISLDYGYAREVLGDGACYIAMDDQRYDRLHTVLDNLSKEQIQQQRQYIAEHRQPWQWSVIASKTKAVYQEMLAS